MSSPSVPLNGVYSESPIPRRPPAAAQSRASRAEANVRLPESVYLCNNKRIPKPVQETQLRQARVADLVADRLRRDILTGRYREGDVLPVSAGLMPEFS